VGKRLTAPLIILLLMSSAAGASKPAFALSEHAGKTAATEVADPRPAPAKVKPAILGALRTTVCSDYQSIRCTEYLIQALDYHWQDRPPTALTVKDLGRNKVILVDHDVGHYLGTIPLNSTGDLLATVWEEGTGEVIRVYRLDGDNVTLVFNEGTKFDPQFIEGESIILINRGREIRGDFILPTITEIWKWDPSTHKFALRATVPITEKFATVASILGERVELVPPPGVSATINVGDTPQGLAVNPVTDKIYVANEGSNNITVIDGASNRTKTIDDVGPGTNPGPTAVAVNPATNRIYVANLFSDTVVVIDGATDKVIAAVPAGHTPVAVAVNPITDRVYVSDGGGNTVTVIDGATNKVVAAVVVGPDPAPGPIAINPVTNRIYVGYGDVGKSGPGTVVAIDGSTNKVSSTPYKGPGFDAIAVDPKTDKIYVADAYLGASGTITVIDPTSGSAKTFALPSRGFALSLSSVAVNPVTNTIYAGSDNADTVSVISGSNSTVLATMDAGPTPSDIAVDPVTDRIYVANHDGNAVTVIDGASTPARPTPMKQSGSSARAQR
jgi:YVTN family beta-propeller protein